MTDPKKFCPSTMITPPKSKGDMVYGVDEKQTSDRCRLVMNGFTCNRHAQNRGLCPSHYQKFMKLKDGSIDLYALPVMSQRGRKRK